MSSGKALRRKETFWALLFIAAPVIQFLVFILGPMLYSLYSGFTDWNGLSKNKSFIGFENYLEILKDEKFWKSLFNTTYILIGVPIYLLLALILAMGLNRKIFGSRFFRLAYYLPYISSLVALAVIWKWLFNSQYGLVNNFINSVFGINGPNWLYDPKWIKACIVLMIIWKLIGFTSVFYLAALQNIPRTYYEAAVIDGASGFRRFWSITFPMITPISFYLLVVGVIGTFQTLIEPIILTKDGGTDYSAATIVYYLYQKAFDGYEMGYASAVATILVVLILILTVIQFKLSNKWVYEGN